MNIITNTTEWAKRTVRLIEARTTNCTRKITFMGKTLRVIKSRWWDDTSPEEFEKEIGPYFKAMTPNRSYRTVIDAGAATGMFAVVFSQQHPESSVVAFEPSPRQRILLQRNARINKSDGNIRVIPLALWNEAATLSFRTHGALSSVAGVSQIPNGFSFNEHVPAIPLDDWARTNTIEDIDLIKMDIEGAETEALEGMTGILREQKPELLIQAYHIRDGVRTFEQCAAMLDSLGYLHTELEDTGLLHAVYAG